MDVESDVAPAKPRPTREASEISASALPAFEFFRRGESVEEVMAKMNRARSTVYGYLQEYLRHDHIMDPSPWVDPTTARRIEAALEEVGGNTLKPIFEHLGGEVPYEEIRVVSICLHNRG